MDKLPKCPECGYIIYKLSRMRCPECGTVIRPEDVSHAPLRVEVERLARRERRMSLVGCVLGVTGLSLIVWVTFGTWAGFLCFFVPLGLTTALTIAYCLYLGDPLHKALLVLGLLWVTVGLFLFLVT